MLLMDSGSGAEEEGMGRALAGYLRDERVWLAQLLALLGLAGGCGWSTGRPPGGALVPLL